MTTRWEAPSRIPYLDGLRAYSIMAVLLSHVAFHVPWFQSRAAIPIDIVFADGHLGVRVFFVLSGFLITTLLLKEKDVSGAISLRGFYERRIARIFPAFYLYMAAILLLNLFHVFHIAWPDLLSAGTFTWNYSFLWGSNSAESGSALGHFWTLSLEEQFYVIWPACLSLFGSRWSRRIGLASLPIFPLIRVLVYFLYPASRGQLVMMFPTGAEQILWGAVAAFGYKDGLLDRLRTARFRSAIPWICAIGVFLLCPLLSYRIRGFSVSFGITLQCCSIVLFIYWILSGEGGVLRRALDSWPMVQLGLVSYSVYIWQQLFLLSSVGNRMNVPLRLLSSLGAGVLSYRLIEIPLRKRIRNWFSVSNPAHG